MTDITLLDGSIGQELVKRSAAPPTPLWSTQVMLDQPELVSQLHTDYFTAGATVATTNTYAVLDDRMPLDPTGQAQIGPLIDTALRAARSARDAAGQDRPLRIAGALGPLGASYRPDICPPAAEAAQLYAAPVARMKDHVDLLLLETMASVDQADGGLRATIPTGLPVWLGLTVMDQDGTRLRSGEPLDQIAPLIARHAPDAVLINCTRPESVAPALTILRDIAPKTGAYANAFTGIADAFLQDAPTVDALSERSDMGPDTYADIALSWLDLGATILGGCCEVGPAHIATLAQRLRAAGHQII